MLKPDLEGHCAALDNVNYANFALSLLLFVGILISYIPQHVRIIKRRSSFGISPYFVLLGTTSGTCAFANILVLPASRADMACCQQIDGFACFAGLLGIGQVGMQWSCFCLILLLFVVFFPRDGTTSDPAKDPTAPTYRTALVVAAVCIAHAVGVVVLSCVFVWAAQDHLQGWANFLGILSTILASIQYFPQIYTTYQLKRVGSLSIPMMCIQTPGSFVWSASLAARLGPAGWSAWGVYLVTGTRQGTLLVMGGYFEYMHRQRERDELGDRMTQGNAAPTANARAEADERRPLLSPE